MAMHKEHWIYLKDIKLTNSISATAVRFDISSQALGKSIRSLENELGFTLLNRSHTGVSLTDEAEKALSLATAFFAELDKIKEETASDESKIGAISLPMAPGMSNQYFAEILLQYQNLFPHIQISIAEYPLSEIIAKLQSHELNFAIVSLIYYNDALLPTYPFPADLSLIPFDSRRLVATVSKSSPLAAKRSLSIADLVDYPFIMASTNQQLDASLASIFPQLSLPIPKKIILESNTVSIYNQVVAFNYVTLTFKNWDDMGPSIMSHIKKIPLKENLKMKMCYLIRAKDNIENLVVPAAHLNYLR